MTDFDLLATQMQTVWSPEFWWGRGYHSLGQIPAIREQRPVVKIWFVAQQDGDYARRNAPMAMREAQAARPKHACFDHGELLLRPAVPVLG